MCLREQRDQMNMDLEKDSPDIQGSKLAPWDDQENRTEGKALKAVATEPTEARGCEEAWCHQQLQEATTRL